MASSKKSHEPRDTYVPTELESLQDFGSLSFALAGQPGVSHGKVPQYPRGVAEDRQRRRLPDRSRASHEPMYVYIANVIADRIAAGIYRPGDQIPTEAQLRAEFGVSPMTVRRAINILLDRGLVTTTQGKGTFVRALDLSEALFRFQQAHGTWTSSSATEVTLLEARILRADLETSQMLQCKIGDPLVHMRRLIKREGIPLVYQVENILYDETRPLVEAQLRVTFLDGLFRASVAEGIPCGELVIRAISLTGEAAKLLEVPEGSPAFCLEHLFRDFKGYPVGWGKFFCRADQFYLFAHVGVPPS